MATSTNRTQQSRKSRWKLKDKKITLYKRTSTQGPSGYPIETYTPVHGGKLWAYVRQTSGEQYYAAMAINVKEEMLFVVNWRADLDLSAAATYFIVYKKSWYDIQRVDTFEGYKEDVQLYANSTRTPSGTIAPYPG